MAKKNNKDKNNTHAEAVKEKRDKKRAARRNNPGKRKIKKLKGIQKANVPQECTVADKNKIRETFRKIKEEMNIKIEGLNPRDDTPQTLIKGNCVPEETVVSHFVTTDSIDSILTFLRNCVTGISYVNRWYKGKMFDYWGNRKSFMFYRLGFCDKSKDPILAKHLIDAKSKKNFVCYFISIYEFNQPNNKKGYVTYLFVRFKPQFNPKITLFNDWLFLHKSLRVYKKIITGRYANKKLIKVVYGWKGNRKFKNLTKDEFVAKLQQKIIKVNGEQKITITEDK